MGRTGIAKKATARLRFFGDVIAELRKVVWPTRQEAIRLTIMVLIVCLIIGVILALADFGFTRLVRDVFLK